MNKYIFMSCNDGFSLGLGFWGLVQLSLKSGFNFLLSHFITAGLSLNC